MNEYPQILVAGDPMLDVYVWCGAHRLSREAPIPIVDFEREEMILGGAANVARNIKAFSGEARVGLLGIVGDDDDGRTINHYSHCEGIECSLITMSANNTTRKTRIMAGEVQICRFDRDMQCAKIHHFQVRGRILPSFTPDALIVSDYAKGFVKWICQYCEEELQTLAKVPIRIIDAKIKNIGLYGPINPNYITINTNELGGHAVIQNFWSLFPDLNAVFETLGSDGVRIWLQNESVEVDPHEVIARDVTGAGDTFISAIAWSLVNGEKNLTDAAKFANKMASLVVEKIGTRTVGD